MKISRSRFRAKLLFIALCFAATGCSSDNPEFDNYKQYAEKKNGITCADLNLQAMRFVQGKIKPLVLAGRNGEDWVAMADIHLLGEIRSYKDKTFQCHLVKSNAQRLGIEMEGEFDTFQQLFSVLDIFITPYDTNPPSANRLKPGAFEKVDTLYRNLTHHSSEAPNGAP